MNKLEDGMKVVSGAAYALTGSDGVQQSYGHFHCSPRAVMIFDVSLTCAAHRCKLFLCRKPSELSSYIVMACNY